MGINILIVDDSSTMRAMVRKTLQMADLPISTFYQAENGKAGLEVLDREWIDLVLVDINMPVMGGLEMIDRIREDPMLASLPVVVVSTESSEARIEEVRQKGVQFIHKPFTPEVVGEVLRKLLGDINDGRDQQSAG